MRRFLIRSKFDILFVSGSFVNLDDPVLWIECQEIAAKSPVAVVGTKALVTKNTWGGGGGGVQTTWNIIEVEIIENYTTYPGSPELC